MDEIDFELCLGVEKHAAVSRREKRLASSISETAIMTENVDEGMRAQDDPREGCEHEREQEQGQGRQQGQEQENETGHYPRSNKRTKISVSGSWHEGEHTWPVEKMETVIKTGDGHQSAPFISYSASESMDCDDNDNESDRQERTPRRPFKTIESESDSRRFTIYEDPYELEDRIDVVHELGLRYILGGWRTSPGDNKENATGFHDHDQEDAETVIDELGFGHGQEGTSHNHHILHNHRAVDVDHSSEATTGLLSMGMNSMDLDPPPRPPRASSSADTEIADVDVNIELVDLHYDHHPHDHQWITADTNTNDENTAPAPTPSPIPSPSDITFEQEILHPTSFRAYYRTPRVSNMSLLQAPPRRFSGRAGRQQRRVLASSGV